MRRYARFELPPSSTLDGLKRGLAQAIGARVESDQTSAGTLMDSFDGRLWKVGAICELESHSGEHWLRWLSVPDARERGAVRLETRPHLASDLPPGPLRARLEPMLEMRALVPLAHLRRRRVTMVVRGSDDLIAVRLFLEQSLIRGARQSRRRRMPLQLQLRPVRGKERAAVAVLESIERMLGRAPLGESWIGEALRRAEVRPGGFSSKPRVALDAHTPAAEAFRRVLHALVEIMRHNEDGTIEDLDPEFLHDFRVAIRRTRSVLASARDVVSEARRAKMAEEFRWLGQLTSPVRDLDVYLLHFDDLLALMPERSASDLDPLHAFLRNRQSAAQRALADSLRSPRYLELREAWRAELEDPDRWIRAAPRSQDPVCQIAGERILRARRRAIRLGRSIRADSPPTDLHEMRKRCKRLRYLMECFRGAFDKGRVATLLRELKLLQDNLGAHQDYCVQADALEQFAREMQAQSEVPLATFMAMGHLVEQLHSLRGRARAEFADRFRRFDRKATRGQFKALYAPPLSAAEGKG
jgi:CHAD domain-containing protein